jgi:imidazolonepropionase-like amidohydrolase
MSTILKNVRIIDSVGNVFENEDLKISKGRIDSIGKITAGKDDDVVDLTGKTITAGLIDAHVHLGSTNRFLNDSVPEDEIKTAMLTLGQAQKFLSKGITTVRNMGTAFNCDIYARNLINAGYFKGPRIVACGKGICITGGHAYFFCHECDTPDEALKACRTQVKAGADMIKLLATGGMATKGSIPNEPQLTEEQMRVVVEAVRNKKVFTAAHCTGLEGAKRAIRAGVKCIEHIQLDEETAIMMKEAGAYYCPTIIMRASIINSTDPRFKFMRDKADPKDIDRKMYAISLCHKYEIPVVAGTDTEDCLLPISMLVEEMTYYEKSGFTKYEVIQTATKNAAELCNISHDIGTLEQGKIADITVYNSNPLDNLLNLKDVYMTIKDGEVLYKN